MATREVIAYLVYSAMITNLFDLETWLCSSDNPLTAVGVTLLRDRISYVQSLAASLPLEDTGDTLYHFLESHNGHMYLNGAEKATLADLIRSFRKALEEKQDKHLMSLLTM